MILGLFLIGASGFNILLSVSRRDVPNEHFSTLTESSFSSGFTLYDVHIDDLNPYSNWEVWSQSKLFSGSGTQDDPYILENMRLYSAIQQYCFLINNSKIHFIIRNCQFFGSKLGDWGIIMINSNNGKIINNTFYNTTSVAVDLTNSSRNKIVNNTIFYTHHGIYVRYGFNNIITGNTITSFFYGISILASSCNVVQDNNMVRCGLNLVGSVSSLTSNTISSTNLVNNKPLICTFNKTDFKFFNYENIGQLILVNCTDAVISKIKISKTTTALLLYHCYRTIIAECYLSHNTLSSIELINCFETEILENIIEGSDNFGIRVNYGGRNVFSNNLINHNHMIGICIEHSNANRVFKNKIYGHQIAIRLFESVGNHVFDNIFIDNNIKFSEEDCNYTNYKNPVAFSKYVPFICSIISMCAISSIILIIFREVKNIKRFF